MNDTLYILIDKKCKGKYNNGNYYLAGITDQYVERENWYDTLYLEKLYFCWDYCSFNNDDILETYKMFQNIVNLKYTLLNYKKENNLDIHVKIELKTF